MKICRPDRAFRRARSGEHYTFRRQRGRPGFSLAYSCADEKGATRKLLQSRLPIGGAQLAGCAFAHRDAFFQKHSTGDIALSLRNTFLWLTTQTEPQPEHHKCDEGARGIEQRVVRRSASAGHERLVNFIRDGISGRNEQSGDAPGPAPSRAPGSHASVQQHAKHKILREVRALSDEVMNEGKLGPSERWPEPTENWLEKRRRVLRGKGVCRHHENEARPSKRRPPRPQQNQGSGPRSVGADFGQAGCGTRIAPGLLVRH